MSNHPDEISHEGKIVTDGRNTFLIKGGRRQWVSSPPPELRQELEIEADRLRRSQSLRQPCPAMP
jgi:hypothetical protein